MGNHYSQTKPICEEILETCAVTNLRKLTRLTTNRFNEHMKSTGLRTTQICVMLAIGRAPGKTLSFYAEELRMDLSTLARSVATLQDSGYIHLDDGVKREKLASLTEAGEKKLAEVYPLWLNAQDEFIRSFGREDWQIYLEAAASDTF